MKCSFRSTAVVLACATLLSGGYAKSATDTPAAAAVPSSGFITVTIGDLPGLLDNAGKLAKAVAGMDASMLKAQVGQMLQDPGLEGMPAGSGIVLVFGQSSQPVGFVEVSDAKADDYAKLIGQRGMKASKVPGGVMFSQEGSKEDATAPDATALKQMLSGSGDPTIKAHVEVQQLLKKFGPQIKAGMDSMQKQVETASASQPGANPQAFAGVIKAYYGMIEGIKDMDLSLRLDEKGVRFDSSTASMKPLAEPAKLSMKMQDVEGFTSGKGAMRMKFAGTELWMEMMQNMMTAMLETSGTQLSADSKQKISEMTKVFTGPGVMDMGFKNGLSGEFVFAVSDGEKAISLYEQMFDKTKFPEFWNMYASMGITYDVSFKRDAREHAGVKIHALSMKANMSQMPDEMQKTMEKFSSAKGEVAVIGKMLVGAMGDEKIDLIIDRVKENKKTSAEPLASEKAFGPDAVAFIDYNVGEVLGAITDNATSAPKQLSSMTSALKQAPPVSIAMKQKNGRFDCSVLVPTGMIKSAAMGAQQMNQPANEDGEETSPSAAEKSSSNPGNLQ